MPAFITFAARIAPLFILGFLLTACGLPAAGPTSKQILANSVENGGDVHIVEVTPEIVTAASRGQALGFGPTFASAGQVSVERINPGDVLTVTIWENVDNGLFSSLGQKVTTLPSIQVNELGNIFVPYAGTIRANGRTPDELRVKLTEVLADQTPDPQVEIRREAGDAATVSLIGEVNAQGVYPIVASNRNLADMIAEAGGISLDPWVVRVTVRRGQESGSIWLQDLFDNPANDIALRSGDNIFIEKDFRYFVTLGATGQRRVVFESHNPSVIEGLAAVGGLRSNVSNPKGIFVFREEPQWIARRVLGDNSIQGAQKIAYVVNLIDDAGMFTAQNFVIRNEDTVYVTQAPYTEWTNILRVAFTTINTVTSIDSAVTNLTEVFE